MGCARRQSFWSRAGDLAFLRVAGSRSGLGIVAITEQCRVEVLQSLRRQAIGTKSYILLDEGVVPQGIRDGREAGRACVGRGERLEEQQRFKMGVGRQRRHPPVPARSAVGEEGLRDRGHGGGVVVGSEGGG